MTIPPDENDENDEDFESRALCPDGGCIGVIGDDGRCKVCGRPADSSPSAVVADVVAGVVAVVVPDRVADAEAEAEADEVDSGDAARELCPDGSCIGLLGDDGRCKVCGRSREA